ncbi:hypothetical protein [Zunongwangia profunda]|uniref:hypothetical protein n=1 Tax=Zunongwangia profunda TaxID=398743 RepID=UPI0030D85BBD
MAILIIYSFNLIYFSLNTFLDDLNSKDTFSNFYFFPGYNKAIRSNSTISHIFSFLKLDVAYGFFGKGLQGPCRIVFEFKDKNDQLIDKVDASQLFNGVNAKTRAITFANRLNLSIMSRINRYTNDLDKATSQQAKEDLEKRIESQKQLLDINLKRMGLELSEKYPDYKLFTSKIYYIQPNEIEKDSHKKRTAYLQWQVIYEKSSQNLTRIED